MLARFRKSPVYRYNINDNVIFHLLCHSRKYRYFYRGRDKRQVNLERAAFLIVRAVLA